MMLDMVFGRFVRVARGELGVPMRDESLMGGVSVVVFLVVPGCFTVMPRSKLVLIGCGEMMFFTRE